MDGTAGSLALLARYTRAVGEPAASVITTYSRAHPIARAVRSVPAAVSPDHEVIVAEGSARAPLALGSVLRRSKGSP